MKLKFNILIIFCIITAFFISSCASPSYSASMTSSELTAALSEKIPQLSDYKEYDSKTVSFLIGDIDEAHEVSMLYSPSSDDQGEIGIIKAENANDASALLNIANNYISNLQSEKRSFVENYLPDEIDKIEGAEARKFGNYVAFAVLDSKTRTEFFAEIENFLKK